MRSDYSKTLGAILIATGVLLVTATPTYYWYNNLVSASDAIVNESTNEPDPIQIDKSIFRFVSDESRIPLKVIIPELGVDLGIRKAQIVKNKWEVFEDLGSYGVGSSLPGTKGNTVIFAHAREKMFLPLKQAKNDMPIYVLTKQGWFDYKITEIKEVKPTDISVIRQTDDETLTMYTCSGFADSKRLIVIAKPI